MSDRKMEVPITIRDYGDLGEVVMYETLTVYDGEKVEVDRERMVARIVPAGTDDGGGA